MNILYYYTTAETMKYILTQGDIFASHISYLNDSEEYINGLRELQEFFVSQTSEGKTISTLDKKAYEDAIKEIPQIFSISFSKEADLLSQWYMYARESGVRLCLEFPEGEQDFEIKGKYEKEKEQKRSVKAALREVHYFTKIGMPYQEYQDEKEKIKKKIQSYAEEIDVDIADDANHIRLWKDMAPYIKNYEFRQEKEERLIFKAIVEDGSALDEKKDVHLIEYRNAKGVLIPYLDVYRKDGWPVVEIMVGPGRNQTRVYNSICHFVEHSALKIPEIDREESMKRFIKGLSSYQVEEKIINEYCEKVKDTVADKQDMRTYKSKIEGILSKNSHKEEYFDRNYYSNCGIIVRKSNAPYEFS